MQRSRRCHLPVANFFGEGCLASQPLRMSTASTVHRVRSCGWRNRGMSDLLHQEPEFAERFLATCFPKHSHGSGSGRQSLQASFADDQFCPESKPILAIAKRKRSVTKSRGWVRRQRWLLLRSWHGNSRSHGTSANTSPSNTMPAHFRHSSSFLRAGTKRQS